MKHKPQTWHNEKDSDSVILPRSEDKSIVVAASTPSLCITDSRSLTLPRARTSSNHGSSIKSSTVIPFLLSILLEIHCLEVEKDTLPLTHHFRYSV